MNEADKHQYIKEFIAALDGMAKNNYFEVHAPKISEALDRVADSIDGLASAVASLKED